MSLDQEIFRVIEEKYGESLSKYLRSIYYSEGKNLDLLHEAVTVIMNAEKAFKNHEGDFSKYAVVCVRNHLRRLKFSKKETPISSLEKEDSAPVQIEDPSARIDNEKETEKEEISLQLLAAFSSLTPYEMLLLFSVTCTKLSMTQLAKITDQPYYSCYKTYTQLLAKLRKDLEASREFLEVFDD